MHAAWKNLLFFHWTTLNLHSLHKSLFNLMKDVKWLLENRLSDFYAYGAFCHFVSLSCLSVCACVRASKQEHSPTGLLSTFNLMSIWDVENLAICCVHNESYFAACFHLRNVGKEVLLFFCFSACCVWWDRCLGRSALEKEARAKRVSTKETIHSEFQLLQDCVIKVKFGTFCYFSSTVFLWWWRGTVVERRSVAGELSLSCAWPAADGWPLMWVSHSLQVSQLG